MTLHLCALLDELEHWLKLIRIVARYVLYARLACIRPATGRLNLGVRGLNRWK